MSYYTHKELEVMAKRNKIARVRQRTRKELSKLINIEYVPNKREMTPVSLRNITTNETIHFKSSGRLAKAIGVNIGSVVHYTRANKPIVVKKGQSETIVPGAYIIGRTS